MTADPNALPDETEGNTGTSTEGTENDSNDPGPVPEDTPTGQ